MSQPHRERYIDPNAADLEAEHRFIQSTSRQIRRIQMQRGDSWLVRFLPAALGPKKHWYARIARHWVNQKPIVCPKLTGADYGGDPDAFCPVCDVCATLETSESEPARDAGYRARANAQWTTYCLVIEKSSGRGSMSIPSSEMILPYTFELYRSTFEELSLFYRNNVKASNPLSVLDLVRGCDFWANKTAKGTRLDKQDPLPILEGLPDNPVDDPRIAKIMEQLHTPRVQLPTQDKLEEVADKLHEFATRGPSESRGRGGRGGDDGERGGGRGGRGGDSDDTYEDDVQPPPRARGRAAPVQDQGEEDDIPGAEAPRRPAPRREVDERQEPAQPARRPVQREAPQPQRGRAQDPEDEPQASDGGQEAQDEEDNGSTPVHRSVTRPPPAPARAAPRPAPERGATLQRPNPNAAAASAARGTARPRDGGKIDETEEVPEESTDKAPSASHPVRDINDDPPPPVSRSGAATPPMSERMKARIDAASQERRP